MAEKANVQSSDGTMIREFYVKNNPCRLLSNNHQMVTRYCVMCGEPRYTEEKWQGNLLYSGRGQGLTTCDKDDVCRNDTLFHSYVPLEEMLLGEYSADKEATAAYCEALRENDSFPFDIFIVCHTTHP